MSMKQFVFLFLILFLLAFVSVPAKSETVIYDNITTTLYKSITIAKDDLNIGLINEYTYDFYIDDFFLGSYKKGDKIFVPDESNVTMVVPESNINTDISSLWDIGHTNFYIALMYSITGLVVVFVIYFLVRKALRK